LTPENNINQMGTERKIKANYDADKLN